MSSIQIASKIKIIKKQNPSMRIFILQLIPNPTLRKRVCFSQTEILILNEQGQKQCEGFLTASECLESLKSNETRALEVTASQPNSIKA